MALPAGIRTCSWGWATWVRNTHNGNSDTTLLSCIMRTLVCFFFFFCNGGSWVAGFLLSVARWRQHEDEECPRMAHFTCAVRGGMSEGCTDGWGPSREYRDALKMGKGLGEVLWSLRWVRKGGCCGQAAAGRQLWGCLGTALPSKKCIWGWADAWQGLTSVMRNYNEERRWDQQPPCKPLIWPGN